MSEKVDKEPIDWQEITPEKRNEVLKQYLDEFHVLHPAVPLDVEGLIRRIDDEG